MTDASPAASHNETAATSGYRLSSAHRIFIGAAFLASGVLGLVYQVLWMKELRLLFGSTAQATATTLTAFFLGLALGGWLAARMAPRIPNALRAYGWAEIGIAVSALFYFLIAGLYAAMFPALYRALGNAPVSFLLVKFLLGVLLFLPAASFMGATLPFLSQHVVSMRGEMGRSVSALYALNTLGAMVGAYLAGFHLPLWLGFQRTYLFAMAASLLLGVLMLAASRRTRKAPELDVASEERPDLEVGRIRMLAFLSGVVTLGLEVLWTHMFAQVLHNSVYSFATVLIAFLAALTLGAYVAYRIAQGWGGWKGRSVLAVCLAGGSLLVALSPNVFYAMTRGLSYVGEGKDFGAYQLQAFGLALKVIFLPTVLLGVVFPYLLKESESHARSVGGTVGTLLAVNTLGAIVGSLVAGFVLLETVGLWGGIRCLAALGFVGVIAAAPSAHRRVLVPVSIGLAVLCFVPIAHPPRLKVDATRETVLQVWEGSSGVTAVIEDDGGRRTKVNNHYTLGGSGAAETERRQGLLPLLLHPHPEAVFYLGLGTGITAGGAMVDPAPRQVTVCEVVPEAVLASRAYFGDYTGGLFEDPRTRILVEDGRTVLRGTSERYDVVVADLFVPWQAGEGTLYSRELYQTIRQRLREDGLFAQWLPLYQMSRREFEIVARTMLAVFPQVTLWRADFSGGKATLALVGSVKPGGIHPEILRDRLLDVKDAQPLVALGDSVSASIPAFLLGYCGNLTEGRDLITEGPVATDDRPLIEYLAPITHRRVGVKKASWFAGQELMDFLENLQQRVPPEQDPFLGNLTAKEQGYVRAGLLVHKGRVFREAENTEEADKVRRELVALLTNLSRM